MGPLDLPGNPHHPDSGMTASEDGLQIVEALQAIAFELRTATLASISKSRPAVLQRLGLNEDGRTPEEEEQHRAAIERRNARLDRAAKHGPSPLLGPRKKP